MAAIRAAKSVRINDLAVKGRALKGHVTFALKAKGEGKKLTLSDLDSYANSLQRDQAEVRSALKTFHNWAVSRGVPGGKEVEAKALKELIDRSVGIARRFDGGNTGLVDKKALQRRTVRALDGLTELSASQAAKPKVTFDGDFQQRASGKLQERSSFQLDYDRSRVERFLGGPAQGGISAFVSINGQAPKEYPLGDPRSGKPNVQVPAGAREVQVWVRAQDAQGKEQYDSDFGRNHRFEVEE